MHMAQLMPLPLTVSSFSEIQNGFTFLVPAHPGSPGQRAVKRVCVCMCVVQAYKEGQQENGPIISEISVDATGNRSISLSCWALSSKPAARRCCGRSMGPTDSNVSKNIFARPRSRPPRSGLEAPVCRLRPRCCHLESYLRPRP